MKKTAGYRFKKDCAEWYFWGRNYPNWEGRQKFYGEMIHRYGVRRVKRYMPHLLPLIKRIDESFANE